MTSSSDNEKKLESDTNFVSKLPYRFKVRSLTFQDDAKSVTWFWRPHSITLLVVVIAFLAYFGIPENEQSSAVNARNGLVFGSLVFLAHAALQFSDGPFIRPHPVVWRLVLGISLLYLIFLVYILFQNPDDGRQSLKFFDPELGQRLPERNYAEDCELYSPDHPSGNPFYNILDNFDRFVVAHTLGWFVKALAFRNLKLLVVCSFVFELLEYMLQFQLPNFEECWWDHWILDFVLCNGTGIVLGLWVCKLLAMREYRWRGFATIPTAKGKIMRAVAQFSPYAWQNFQWGPFKDLKHWVATLFVIWMMLCADLNAFYFKSALWIPADHWFNLVRILYAGMAAPVAVAETYAYVTDPDCKKLGHQTTVVTLILSEVLIIFKYWEFEPIMNADPVWLIVSGVTLAVLALITIFYIFRELCGKTFPEEEEEEREGEEEEKKLEQKQQQQHNQTNTKLSGLERKLPLPTSPIKSAQLRRKISAKDHEVSISDHALKSVQCTRFEFPSPQFDSDSLDIVPPLHWPRQTPASPSTSSRTPPSLADATHRGAPGSRSLPKLSVQSGNQPLLSDKLEERRTQFARSLVKECRNKVKKMVLVASQQESTLRVQSQENTMVAGLCDLLERVFRNGVKTQTKSSLWHFLRCCVKTGTLPHQVSKCISTVSEMEFVQSDVGLGRAWIRLLLERKELSQHLELCFRSGTVILDLYKSYAFLQHEELRTQVVSYLLSLTTIPFSCFTDNYPPVFMSYSISINTANFFTAGTTSSTSFRLVGQLSETDVVECGKSPLFGKGATFTYQLSHQNLGHLTSFILSHDNSGLNPSWTVDSVKVVNTTTKAVTMFSCYKRIPKAKGGVFTLTLSPDDEFEAQPQQGQEDAENPQIHLTDEAHKAAQLLLEKMASAVNVVVRFMYDSDSPVYNGEANSDTLKAQLLLGEGRVITSGRFKSLLDHPQTQFQVDGGRTSRRIRLQESVDGLEDDTKPHLQKLYSIAEVFGDLLLHGMKRTRVFSSKKHPWDVLEKCSEEVTTDSSIDPEGIFIEACSKAREKFPSKQSRFEWVICSGAAHHVLHVWVNLFGNFAQRGKLYVREEASLCDGPTLAGLSGLLRFLVDLNIEFCDNLTFVDSGRMKSGGKWAIKASSTQTRRSPNHSSSAHRNSNNNEQQPTEFLRQQRPQRKLKKQHPITPESHENKEEGERRFSANI
eukprot:m.122267 g.122267  ORF g.122267 m.122267 type:complete len:1192 (-) comp12936_c0_seq8:116-3691(-)